MQSDAHDSSQQSSQRFVFIINPISGKGRTVKLWAKLKHSLEDRGVGFVEMVTSGPGDAETMAASLPANTRAVVSVGGDGTLNEVVNGLSGRWLDLEGYETVPIPLGLLPTGSGNDFARAAGLAHPLSTVLESILAVITRRIDIGRVNGRYFLNVSGAGFDAEVVSKFNRGFFDGRLVINGTPGYLAALFTTLASFKSTRIHIRLDSKAPVEEDILLIAVGNGQYFGGGMKITPNANLSDGLLDVCWVRSMSKIPFIGSLASVFKGNHLANPSVGYAKAKFISIDGQPIRVQADGELSGCLPMTWSIIPGALNLIVLQNDI